MGVEEQVSQVSEKAIDVLGERPLMLGVLLLICAFLAFTAWSDHDAEQQHQEMLLKILEYRHNEMISLLDKITPSKPTPPVGGPF